jgi:hypothetical protein
MIRNTWVDVNPDWVDYLEARIEAMSAKIKNQQQELQDAERRIEMYRVLVQSVSMQGDQTLQQ